MVFQKICSNITHIWEVTINYSLEIAKSRRMYNKGKKALNKTGNPSEF
jgi:hypothetical protein